jgi:hypothetical protein
MTRTDRRNFLRGLFGAPASHSAPLASAKAPPSVTGTAGKGFSLEDFYAGRQKSGAAAEPLPEIRVAEEALAANITATSVGIPPAPEDPATLLGIQSAPATRKNG